MAGCWEKKGSCRWSLSVAAGGEGDSVATLCQFVTHLMQECDVRNRTCTCAHAAVGHLVPLGARRSRAKCWNCCGIVLYWKPLWQSEFLYSYDTSIALLLVYIIPFVSRISFKCTKYDKTNKNEDKVRMSEDIFMSFAGSKVYYPSGKISQSPSFIFNKKKR